MECESLLHPHNSESPTGGLEYWLIERFSVLTQATRRHFYFNDMDTPTSVNIPMFEWHCANCGTVMCMPEETNVQLRANHKTFYCINGHPNFYNKKTPIEETEDKLMNEYAKNAQLEARIKELEKSLINRIFKK